MTDCFIYDAVRTPRGKGRKKDGALADAPPLRMAKRCRNDPTSTVKRSKT